jgi:hypothetical protein
MYFCRVLLVSFSVLSLGSGALFSQVAVERAPSTEENSVELSPTPIPEEKPEPEKPKKATPVEKSAEVKPPLKSVETMSPEEFKAAGLDKLSPEELKNLDATLKGYRRAVETKAAEKATAKANAEAEKKAKTTRVKINRVDSRVDGTITRVTGHSIIRLEDGSLWRQASAEDRFPAQVVDHPSASVFRTGFGWKMRIAGMPEFYVDSISP